VTVLPVDVKPWVRDDVSRALQSGSSFGGLNLRLALGRVLFDLQYHLPSNLALYKPQRIPRSPQCFWYDRIYVVDATKIRGFHFVVRDSDPALLEVIWVVPSTL
jgi:hypothetical protein